MVRRGSVTVLHTDDYDYQINNNNNNNPNNSNSNNSNYSNNGTSIITICSEETTLQSGMMLNHCILYREVNFKTFHLKPFGFTKEFENKIAFICIRYNIQGMLYDENITFSMANNYLNNLNNNNNTNNSNNNNSSNNNTNQSNMIHSSHSNRIMSYDNNEFIWLHVVDKQCLSLLSKKFSMPMIAINAFMDVIPRTTFNIFGDGSILLTVTSFCRHDDGIICSVKVCCYIKHNVIIVHERRTHASVQEVSKDLLVSHHSGIDGNSISPKNAQQHRLSETHKTSSFGTSLRNVLHSVKASHVTEAETKEQHQDNNSNVIGTYSGRVYLDLKQKLSTSSAYDRIKTSGASYFLYEVIYTMLEMITPVISFYSQRQLALHDTVYVREQPPTHSEGNLILDRVDFIESGFQLMENLTERATLCLTGNREKLSHVMPDEYVSDIISSYEHALDVITDMHEELKRITENINGIITRRNEQISIVLSLVATVFLPLTFIAGVFGMNFSNGGILVYMLEVSHGEDYFWGSCVFCIVACLYIFISKGWMDMLGKVRRGGQSNVLNSNGTGIVSYMEVKWNNIWKKHSKISDTN